jgi:uncharacterized OsmC-like protein
MLQRYLRWGLGAILLPLTVVSVSLAGCLAMVASIAMHPLRSELARVRNELEEAAKSELREAHREELRGDLSGDQRSRWRKVTVQQQIAHR